MNNTKDLHDLKCMKMKLQVHRDFFTNDGGQQ